MQPKKSALKKGQSKESAAAASTATAPASSATSSASQPGLVMEEEVRHHPPCAYACLDQNRLAFGMLIIEDCTIHTYDALLANQG